MKKVAIHSLGCKVNSYEAESMEIMLRDEGYEIVPFSEDVQADIYIINTCSVTNIADKRNLGANLVRPSYLQYYLRKNLIL